MSGHGRRPLNKGNQTAMSSQIQHVQTDPFFFFFINFLVESFDMLPCVCCLCCSPPSSFFFFLENKVIFKIFFI